MCVWQSSLPLLVGFGEDCCRGVVKGVLIELIGGWLTGEGVRGPGR